MSRRARCIVFTGILFALSSFIGCGGNFSVSLPVPTPIVNPKIKHIVIIMQENRTFDNMFNGFPGADTVQTGMSDGVSVPLQPVRLEHGSLLDNSHPGWWRNWDNGKMDGFASTQYPTPNLAYAYVPQSETVPYWTLAKAYTLADRMFQSNTGPSFAAHQYMIAAQSGKTDGNPTGPIWGCDATPETRVALLGPNGTDLPGVFPCFDYLTMADNLDTKGITWKFYTAPTSSGFMWSAFQAIRHIRFGPDWTNNLVSPETKVLADIKNGQLAQVTWIIPENAFSDHAGPGATAEGPDWVASITNAI
jgi:phospholipase C